MSSTMGKSQDANRFKTAINAKSPYMSQSAAKIKPAAGSANLMSPHIAAQDTLGANKRIRADMISKSLFASS